MRSVQTHSLLVLLLLLAVTATGCGDDEPTAPSTTAATTSTETTVDEPAPPRTVEDDESDESDAQDVEPTPAARAAGAGLDRLAAAYAPVSARINFLVTAETLRADAVGSNAGEDVEQERAGVVRIESKRMEGVLDAARPGVAAVPVRTVAQQQVQQLLLEAIDARRRAMVELRAAIQAEGDGLADRIVEARITTWRASWDASVRATREATTITQEARAALGLEPAPEEALR